MSSIFEHKVERSSSSHAILETSSRKRKAAKIRSILGEVTDFSRSSVLDIGTGSGDIAYELAKFAKKVTSVDIVDERKEKRGYTFELAKDEKLPFKDESFDVVITNHVVEHTPDQSKHISEVMRVLKPGGFIYIATPNKFWLSDPHYKLPFISWMPRGMSAKYLHLIQKAKWDIYPLSARKLKTYFKGHNIVNALPMLIVSDAGRSLDMWKGAQKIGKYVPKKALQLTQYVSPTLIFVVEKRISKK